MSGLARPIRVCDAHVARLSCKQGCLGVELDSVAEMTSFYPHCHLCKATVTGATQRVMTLRRCPHHGCAGRYHRSSIDELFIAERLSAAARRLRHPLRGAVAA